MADHYPLLDSVKMPEQLRQLSRKQLPELAQELRSFLVESVAQTGGHLSSNLGVLNSPLPCIMCSIPQMTD